MINFHAENTMGPTNEQFDDDDLTQQATHVVKVTSNLLNLQQNSKFCDVCLLCSNGYVEGRLLVNKLDSLETENS